MTTAATARVCRAVLDEVERAIVGKRDVLELVLLGILADGHVLLEDVPGLGKTLMARSFAAVLGLDFRRIQFTPDLLPADVTGASIYNQRDAVFEFRAGPIFTNLLLADEINRTPPKTQAALLEAMAERQVTVEGETRRLPAPFVVIATDNPIEYEGTYPLPEAQLDRFLLRTGLGYLPADDEAALFARRIDRRTDEVTLTARTSAAEVLTLRASLEEIYVSSDVLRYIVGLLTATRVHPSVSLGASPGGGLAVLGLARGRAMLAGRDFVAPEDIKAVAVPALAHRLTLRPELWVRQVSSEAIMAEVLDQVPTPATLRGAVTPAALRWQLSPLARQLVALTTFALALALATRRAELLPLAAPALVGLVVGARVGPAVIVEVTASATPRRCFEGEPVQLRVTVRTSSPLEELRGVLALTPGVREAPDSTVQAVADDAAEVTVESVVVPGRWGRWSPGVVAVHARAGRRLRAGTATVPLDLDILVFPNPAAARAGAIPRSLPYGIGDHASRQPASGIEFAGIRRYVVGDAARRINWPVSTRRGSLHVTTHAAERPVDVRVVVDAFSDVGPAGGSSLDLAVRGAAGLARTYLRQRDRVGLVVLGGRLQWLSPSIGQRQFYRVIEAVMG